MHELDPASVTAALPLLLVVLEVSCAQVANGVSTDSKIHIPSVPNRVANGASKDSETHIPSVPGTSRLSS